jgi:hypothetical protein
MNLVRVKEIEYIFSMNRFNKKCIFIKCYISIELIFEIRV